MKILMVCLGNICRSPIAHGLLQHKVDELGLGWEVDSCGTSDWHAGELPHERSIAIMQKNGIDITYQRSRPLQVHDLQHYDHLYVMDSDNYRNVTALARNEEERQKVKLILNEVHPGMNQAVPDPYGMNELHYQQVYELLDEATDKIIEKLSAKKDL